MTGRAPARRGPPGPARRVEALGEPAAECTATRTCSSVSTPSATTPIPIVVRHLADRADDRGVVGAVGEVLDEGAVELDHREGQPLQVAERGEADAEVVEDQAHAQASSAIAGSARRRSVSSSSVALGQLQPERRGLDPVRPDRSPRGAESSSGSASWRAERLTATATGRGVGLEPLPGRGLPAGLLDHPAADRHDQPRAPRRPG